MELVVFISTLFYRYDIEPEHPELKELPSVEVRRSLTEAFADRSQGFLRKPTGSVLRVRRRSS